MAKQLTGEERVAANAIRAERRRNKAAKMTEAERAEASRIKNEKRRRRRANQPESQRVRENKVRREIRRSRVADMTDDQRSIENLKHTERVKARESKMTSEERETAAERKLKRDREYRERNREALCVYNKKWRNDNAERNASSKKLWYGKNKSSINATKAEQRASRTDAEKEETRIYMREYQRNRNASDYAFKLRGVLTVRVRLAIFAQGAKKKARTADLVGCDWGFLRAYLETRFEAGMSWENHGEWEIDHIISISSFDLTKLSEQRKASHYTNLQPLWKADNLAKSNKVDIQQELFQS